jgi:transcriptional regulator with XRE-family HTH domain
MKKTRSRLERMPFSKILRSLMSEKRITVRKAAEYAAVGPSTIDSWRAGALPEDYAAVKRLAKHLDVSFSFLLTGEDETHASKSPGITEVFDDGGNLFDGYAKITIQRLLPRKGEVKS